MKLIAKDVQLNNYLGWEGYKHDPWSSNCIDYGGVEASNFKTSKGNISSMDWLWLGFKTIFLLPFFLLTIVI